MNTEEGFGEKGFVFDIVVFSKICEFRAHRTELRPVASKTISAEVSDSDFCRRIRELEFVRRGSWCCVQ